MHNYKLKQFINLHGGMDYGHMAKEFIRNASLTTIYNILHVRIKKSQLESLVNAKEVASLESLLGMVAEFTNSTRLLYVTTVY